VGADFLGRAVEGQRLGLAVNDVSDSSSRFEAVSTVDVTTVRSVGGGTGEDSTGPVRWDWITNWFLRVDKEFQASEVGFEGIKGVHGKACSQ
jgi:hypothetical protein